MDYLSHNVAVNLKRLRTSKGMSMDVVAEQTGVSKSMLARIESDNANPSIGVLGKIASGLRVTINELLETPPMASSLMDINETIPTKEVVGQYKVWTCFPYEDNKIVEVYRIDIEPGGIYVSGGHGEKTREYLSVINGVVTIHTVDTIQEVTTDQVFRFETDAQHTYQNNTAQKVSVMIYFLDYH